MSGKNRRDSLDDFKADPFPRPPAKPKLAPPPPAKPSVAAAVKQESSLPSKENTARNCAICGTTLTEVQYADHFAACMKQRAAKMAAAAKAAKAGVGKNVRPITDFISIKPSPSSNKSSSTTNVATKQQVDEQPSTSTSCQESTLVSEAASIVLPYCPVCGRVIKSDRSYAPHLKQCAKKYNVVPDLLVELSKKQMTLQIAASSPASETSSVKPKKRPAKFFEIPTSVEDEQLQLAVALSASVMETHVNHLPIVSIPENAEECGGAPSKRMKRQVSADLKVAAAASRDPADAQIRLLELINQRFSNSSDESPCKRNSFSSVEGKSSSRLFHLACSSPNTLSQAIVTSSTLSEMPSEFNIETGDFDLPADISDKTIIVGTKDDFPDKHSRSSISQETVLKTKSQQSGDSVIMHDSTLTIANNFDRHTSFITSTMAPIGDAQQPITISSSSSSSDRSSQTDDDNDQNGSCLSADMLRLFNNQMTTDVLFVSSDSSLVGAHRLIVFARCPGLVSQRTLRQTAITDTNYRLSSYSSEFISAFLAFVYTGIRNLDFGDEIETLYQSFQSEDNVEEVVPSPSKVPAGSTSPEPAICPPPITMETPALPSNLPPESSSLSVDSSPVNVYYDASSNGVDDWPSPNSNNKPSESPAIVESFDNYLPPISPNSNFSNNGHDRLSSSVDYDNNKPSSVVTVTSATGSPVSIIQEKAAEEEVYFPATITAVAAPDVGENDNDPPPLGDEWMDFDNPVTYDDCCYSSELPLSQQQIITQEENDMIAEFDQMRQQQDDDKSTITTTTHTATPDVVMTTTKVASSSKSKLTAAGKTRPRVSIVGLSSVAPQTKKAASKKMTPATPADAVIVQRTTPPFSQMATPNLAKLLSKYGVRKLPKKHMVLKLKEIHSILQPKQDQVESAAVNIHRPPREEVVGGPSRTQPQKPTKPDVKKPTHWKALIKGSKFSDDSSSSEEEQEEENQEEDSDDEENVTLEPNALSLLDDIEDEDLEDGNNDDEEVAFFFSQSQSVTASQQVAKKKKPAKVPKIVCFGEEFTERVSAFIRSDRELYTDLLQFKPLPFKDIYTKVRKVGNFACSKQQLVDFLDEQCITFRLAPGKSHRPPPPPPVEKKPKKSKKQQPSS